MSVHIYIDSDIYTHTPVVAQEQVHKPHHVRLQVQQAERFLLALTCPNTLPLTAVALGFWVGACVYACVCKEGGREGERKPRARERDLTRRVRCQRAGCK